MITTVSAPLFTSVPRSCHIHHICSLFACPVPLLPSPLSPSNLSLIKQVGSAGILLETTAIKRTLSGLNLKVWGGRGRGKTTVACWPMSMSSDRFPRLFSRHFQHRENSVFSRDWLQDCFDREPPPPLNSPTPREMGKCDKCESRPSGFFRYLHVGTVRGSPHPLGWGGGVSYTKQEVNMIFQSMAYLGTSCESRKFANTVVDTSSAEAWKCCRCKTITG
jgi:hypothetical protein